MEYQTETLTLSDGRQLEFLAQGPNDGRPLVYLHGTPGALHDHSQHAELYMELGVRMISVNRPGTGASTFQEGWSALSFAGDLKQLLNSLGIAQATVVGFSAGGLYACAFVHQYPKLVSRLALLSSVGPFDLPQLDTARSEATKGFHDAARDMPEALLEQFAAVTSGEALLGLVNTQVSPVDQAIFARPGVARQMQLSYNAVMQQGLDKFIVETANINRPWGFSPSEITTETLLWHSTADINIPVECSEYLAEVMPNAKPSYLEGAGHFYSFKEWPELLRRIVAD